MSGERVECWDDDDQEYVEVTKPECGAAGTPAAGSPSGTVDSTVSTIIGVITTVMSIWGWLESVAEGEGLLGVTIDFLGFEAALGYWLASIAGAAIIVTIVAAYWNDRCGSKETDPACTAGVIQEIIPAFSRSGTGLFPFGAQHDRVDTVVRCRYWPVVSSSATYVLCGNDPDASPMMAGYYHNKQVCGAGKGATIGAAIAGAVGAVAGAAGGAAAGAALGCAAGGPITLLACAAAILLAFLIAAVAALIGAVAGGHIGKAAADDTTPRSEGGDRLTVGDYVTRSGGVLLHPGTNRAKVYWFVEDTHLHGRAPGQPPYSYGDLEDDFRMDAC